MFAVDLKDTALTDLSNADPDFAPKTVRIALGQVAPTLGNVPRNSEIHLTAIHSAKAQNADVLVFPELSLTGYDLRDQVSEVALGVESKVIQQLIQSAGPMGVAIGFVEQTRQQHYYNSAVYAEDGVVQHVHRKVYLPTYGLFDEGRYFAPGNRIQAFDSPKLGRVGILICEDFWHLSTALIMQAEEVDLLICMSNSPARGITGERISTQRTYDLLCTTYAQALGAAVVFVNRAGYDDGLCFWGGSMLVGPGGDVIQQAKLFEEDLIVVEFNRGELRRERLLTPLGRDERLLLTIEELERIRRQRYES